MASVGTVGDSYDNALAETVNGLYKAELIYPSGSGSQSARLSSPRWAGSTGGTPPGSTKLGYRTRRTSKRPTPHHDDRACDRVTTERNPGRFRSWWGGPGCVRGRGWPARVSGRGDGRQRERGLGAAVYERGLGEFGQWLGGGSGAVGDPQGGGEGVGDRAASGFGQLGQGGLDVVVYPAASTLPDTAIPMAAPISRAASLTAAATPCLATGCRRRWRRWPGGAQSQPGAQDQQRPQQVWVVGGQGQPAHQEESGRDGEQPGDGHRPQPDPARQPRRDHRDRHQRHRHRHQAQRRTERPVPEDQLQVLHQQQEHPEGDQELDGHRQ